MIKKISCMFIMLVIVYSLMSCVQNDYIEVDAKDMIELHTWFFTSGIPNNAIVFQHENKSTDFDCVVDKGQFRSDKNDLKTVVAQSGDTIYWNNVLEVQQAFISVIVRLDDNIVGYGVIKIVQNDGPADHSATVLKAVLLPKVGNEYQKVSEKRIAEIINKIIIKNKGDTA